MRIKQGVSHYNSMVVSTIWQMAVACFQALQHNFKPDIVSYNALAGKAGWKIAFTSLTQAGLKSLQLDRLTFHALLKSFSNDSSQWELAFAALDMMRVRCIADHRSTHTYILGALAVSNEWRRSLFSLCSKPDFDDCSVIDFNVAMNACSKAQLWKASISLLRSLADNFVLPDAVSFAAGLVKVAKQWQFASVFLEDMCISKIRPTVKWHNRVGHASTSSWLQTLACMQFAQHSHIVADSVTWNTCLSCLEWEAALVLWTHMDKLQDEIADVLLMKSLASSVTSFWIEAISLLSAMRARLHRPSLMVRSAAMKTAEVGDRWTEALCLFSRSTADTATYSAIASVSKGSRWHKGLHIVASVATVGLENDIISMNQGLSALGLNQWRMASDLLRCIVRVQLQATQASHTSALVTFPWEYALGMSNLAAIACQTDTASSNAVLASCERGSQWRECLRLLDRMSNYHWMHWRGSKLPQLPDEQTFDAVI